MIIDPMQKIQIILPLKQREIIDRIRKTRIILDLKEKQEKSNQELKRIKMKQTYNKILTTIKSSLDLLYNHRREKEIQNFIITQLNTEVRTFKQL